MAEDLDSKVRTLELNAKQFYAQLKPLFVENAQLKSHVISLNYFIEERKNQLAPLIKDTGPNGEDRIIIKAIGDLKQICDLIEEERHFENKINEDQSILIQEQQAKILKQTEIIENINDKHLKEKQLLIDQTHKVQEYHKSVVAELEKKANQSKMRAEDFQSQIMQLRLQIKQIHIDHEELLQTHTKHLQDQIQKQKLNFQHAQEDFENERRTYLKQMEQLAQKTKEIREEVTSQFEYKMASQKAKLDDHIQKLIQENRELRQQVQLLSNDEIHKAKAKILQEQVNKYRDQMQQQADEFDSERRNYQAQIDQLNSDLKKLKDQAKQISETKIDSIKAKSEDQIRKLQQENKELRQINQTLKNKESVKFKTRSLQESAIKSPVKSSTENIQPDHSFEQERKQYQKQLEQFTFKMKEIEEEAILEAEQKLTQVKALLENQINTLEKENQELKELHQNDQQSIQILSLNSPNKQKLFQFQHIATQCNILSDQQTDIRIIDLTDQIEQLTSQLITKDEKYNRDVQKLSDQVNESQMNMNYQGELLDQLDRKNLSIQKLKDELADKEDRINGLENTIEQYNAHIEYLDKKFQQDLSSKDEEKKQIENIILQQEGEAQREQQRLLKLGQEIKNHLESEIQNLMNQHALDQEIVKQEKLKYEQQKQNNLQFKVETQHLIEQVRSKEQLLDSYRRELIKSSEIVKYLQLEVENYKKMNNIFRPKNQDINLIQNNGMSFLPIEVQDKIRVKLNKLKYKEQLQPKQYEKDVYANNFQHQKLKMKGARTQQLINVQHQPIDDNKNVYNMFKGRFEQEDLPKIHSKRQKAQHDRSLSDHKSTNYQTHVRSKTQVDDYEEDKFKDIQQREVMLIQQSQNLLSQLNTQARRKFKV